MRLIRRHRAKGAQTMKIPAAILMSVVAVASAEAGTWRFGAGVAYVTGISDVADHYEENLERAGREAEVDLRFPLGVGASATYLWKNDIRADIGLGPMFSISGDVHHFELPLNATVGYSFLSTSNISPYVRAGLVYHYVDGDQYSDTSPGLLAAVGVDFSHFTIEIATDRSEVEFDALECTTATSCALTTEKLNTYDLIASFYYRF
jgi:opacity protein-like surface antigen